MSLKLIKVAEAPISGMWENKGAVQGAREGNQATAVRTGSNNGDKRKACTCSGGFAGGAEEERGAENG